MAKLKGYEQDLQAFCKETHRRNDTFRSQVQGFDRSQAQKAVWANKRLTSEGESGIIKIRSRLSVNTQFFGGNRNIKKLKSNALRKSITSWNREIAEHQDKIQHPEKYYPLWGTFDVRLQNGYKKHWEKEIQTMKADIERAMKELKERGDSYE